MPLVRRPDAARLPPPVRETLRHLAAHPRVGLAILSGRSLLDLRHRVCLRGILYGGCHGLEIDGPGLRFRHPLAPGHRLRIRRATAALGAMLPRFPGARLEPKGLALAVHYRGLSPSRRAALYRRVKRVAAQAVLTILPGKKVWDLVPPGHRGKAKALRLIRDCLKTRVRGGPLLTLYAGDDATDAEAFRALPPRALGIQVGGVRGPADFRLRNVPKVHALLRWIAERIASPSASSMPPAAPSSCP
ncbi:MAG: trehalose-phosphatase [candidate division NC10 bacterium]|nr:trehalose-phosphatase [candidate division NC10 bacterium]